MSYNTRRTGGAVGRGTGATQVNYHQQPARGPGNITQQQSRNPGYTTQQAPVSYNSAAQPAYSTQSGYTTTTTPQPKATVIQPPLPTQPPPTQKPVTPASKPVTPVVKPPIPAVKTPVTPLQPKVEPLTPQDTPKMDTQENGEEQVSKPDKIPFWRKKGALPKLSNKVRKARHNAKLRRVLNPKNAITFLNELKPGRIKFVVKEESNWGYSATVVIDGKPFTGHGMSVSKAKMHSSELALKHLLMEQLAKSAMHPASAADVKDEKVEDAMETDEVGDDGETKPKKAKRAPPPEDDVPWGSLAAFALHKLFKEWQAEGGEGMSMSMPEPQDEKFGEPMSEDAYYNQRVPDFFPRRFPGPGPFPRPAARGRGFSGPFPRGGPPPAFSMARRPLPAAATFLTGTRPLPGMPGNMQPMKKIPEDAGQRHPVMLLNQLKPDVVYNEGREGVPPNTIFIISVNIDGKEYIGKGRNKKDAKKFAAVAALAPLGIKFQEPPAK